MVMAIADRIHGRSSSTFRRLPAATSSRDRLHSNLVAAANSRGLAGVMVSAEADAFETPLESWRHGTSIDELSRRLGRSRAAVHAELLEARVADLRSANMDFIDSAEFSKPGAEKAICGRMPVIVDDEVIARPADLPAYIGAMYTVPLLNREQEQHFFRRMNFRKFQFVKLRAEYDGERMTAKVAAQLEQWRDEIAEIRDLLIRSNLRLVVSVARKYLRSGIAFFDLVSDGNVSVMRAVEKFDYARGNKFSTYATWAIVKNFARSIPAEHQRLDRFRTGQEEAFVGSLESKGALTSDERANQIQKSVIRELLTELDGRERQVLAFRFGLDEGRDPETLEQVGLRLGVTKERVRQIEVKSLEKLRRIVEHRKCDIPGY